MPNPHTNPRIKNTLLTLLVFLKHKAEEKDLEPVIPVAKVIDLLRGSGLKLSYQQLVDLTQDPSIAPSIKSINKSQLELNLGEEDETPAPAMDIPMEPEEGEGEDQGEEFNSDDFSFPEGEGEQAPVEGQPAQAAAPAPEEEPQGKPQQSIVTQMAKRAAARPD